MKKILLMTVGIIAFVASSCASLKGPESFVKAMDGGTWSSIMIREGLSYDKAFNEVLDVVSKRFEMDMISKEGGYGRTNWIYTWNTNGVYVNNYRTRVVFKFNADRTKIDIKTEAEFNQGGVWVKGYDTQLLSTMKQDISGVVGRTVL